MVVTISECQEAFGHPVHGKEFDELCSAIIKRGRALGVMLLLDTQRPDAKTLPGGIASTSASGTACGSWTRHQRHAAPRRHLQGGNPGDRVRGR